MKRVLTVVSIILLVLWMGLAFCAFAQFGGIQSDEVYARAYGAKGFATLTNALAQIGSNVSRTLVIDGGTWTVTTNVDWPSNIAMKVTHDSSISIATGSVMTLDGVNIVEPANRLMFPGLGIATGPIGNAYAMANWQGDRSFYLAPLIAPSSFATTGDVSSITNDLITIITNGDASTSNGVTLWASNALDNVSNGVSLYAREQVAVVSNYADATFLLTGSPVQVSSISYTSYPFMGSSLGITQAAAQVLYATNINTWVKLQNIYQTGDELSNYGDYWNETNQRYTAGTRGRYKINSVISMSFPPGVTNISRGELALVRNAPATPTSTASNVLPAGDLVLRMGDVSSPGKGTASIAMPGWQTFYCDDTSDYYEIWVNPGQLSTVTVGNILIEYAGSTNFVK